METGAIIVSKDADFRDLLERLWPRGQLLWIRAGNVLNRILIQRLETEWPRLQRELGSGVAVVELA
jgi:predicted nuclease of predicted toxin-antitoxin system